MRIPRLKPLRERRQVISSFKGYDRRSIIDDGAFFDMENLTLDEYPTLRVRGKHGTISSLEDEGPITGIFEANGAMGYTRFKASGSPAENHGTITFTDAGGTVRNVDLGLSDEPKKFIRMGAYIIIHPDLAWINTADLTAQPEHGSLAEKKYVISESQSAITVVPVDENGTALVYTSSGTEPATPALGNLWYSTGTRELLQYYEQGWMPYVGKTYIKMSWDSLTADAFDFETGLTIKIDAAGFSGDLIGTRLRDGYYKLIKTDTSDGHPYIIIEHPFLAGTASSYDTIELSWGLPKMDHIIECGNRLWGCYYGKSYQVIERVGRYVTVNEIYASELGNFKEWRNYEGTSMDSYTASLGSDGPFTGAVTYQGYPIFFKERFMHKVYGSYPAQFQIQTTEVKGVEEGCDRSLAIVNNVLYYKSREGFCVYDGSLPVVISNALWKKTYRAVSAGAHEQKYFVSAKDGDLAVTLIYDAKLGVWNRAEGRPYALDGTPTLWASINGDMRYINADDALPVVHSWDQGNPDPDPVEWYAETGVMGLSYQDGGYTVSDTERKYVERLTIRARLAVGSYMAVEIQYNDGEFRTISRIAGYNLDSFSLPVPVRRCDHFRLRLSGRGDAQIYSIAKTMQGGSEK